MAYSGYFLKVNGSIYPRDLMKISTYNVTPNQVQDQDDYTDGKGFLRRKTLPHTRTKAEFETPELWQASISALEVLFGKDETITVEYWNPKKAQYSTGTFYRPAIQYNIIDDTPTDVHYAGFRIALIEY